MTLRCFQKDEILNCDGYKRGPCRYLEERAVLEPPVFRDSDMAHVKGFTSFLVVRAREKMTWHLFAPEKPCFSGQLDLQFRMTRRPLRSGYNEKDKDKPDEFHCHLLV